jgi:hypothetical protein
VIVRGKIIFVTGIAIGYVLGARAGRERYLQIKASVSKLWNDPRVQQQVKQAETFAKDKAPDVVDFISDSAKKVASQVAGSRKVAAKTQAPAKKATTRRSTAKSQAST